MAAFIAVGAAAVASHEMWRDEAQAWLLAKDQTSLAGVIQASRYEKHPLGWFLVLFVLSRVIASPLIMQVFHLGLAALTAFLIFKYSPFSLVQKIFAVFGYTLLFEYGVISRNYALGVLCLFLFCALYPGFRDRPLVLSLPLFVMANTSVHALIVVMAIGLVLAVDILRRRALRTSWRSYAAIAVIILGGLLAYLQLRPLPDSLYDRSAAIHLELNLGLAQDVLKLIPRAFWPLPQITFHFWNSSILDGLALPFLGDALLALLVVVPAVFCLRKRPPALMVYILGTSGLLAWFYLANTGFARHRGWLFIVFLAALWLAGVRREGEAGAEAASARARPRGKLLNGWLMVVFSAQFAAGLFAVGMDLVHPFSQSRNVARIIQAKGYERLPIVADVDYVASPVSGYLGRRMYYPRAGRLGSYVVWDVRRLSVVKPWLMLTWAERYSWMKDSDCLILMNYSFDQGFEDPDRLRLLTKTPRAIVKDEHYSLYLFKRSKKSTQAESGD